MEIGCSVHVNRHLWNLLEDDSWSSVVDGWHETAEELDLELTGKVRRVAIERVKG